MNRILLIAVMILLSSQFSGATDITWADKSTGGAFTASDANAVKAAVNSKVDQSYFDTLSSSVDSMLFGDFAPAGNWDLSLLETFTTGPIGFVSNDSEYYMYINPSGLTDYRPVGMGDYAGRIVNASDVDENGHVTTASSNYVATPWEYSNSPCTPGQYSFTADGGYKLDCVASGNIKKTALTAWSAADPTTYTLTFTVVGASSYTIGGVSRSAAGSPYSITGLSGAVGITALYGGTDNAIEFSGTNGADVSGSYPNYSITMDAAKAVTATSTAPPPSGTYDDIFLYTGFNTITTALDKGTGYVTWSGNMLLNTATPINGAGSLDNNNANYARTLVVDDNIDWENLNMLVKFRPKELAPGEVFYCSDQTLKLAANSLGTSLTLTYKDQSASYVHGFAGDGSTAYAITVKTTATTATLYVDGVQKMAITGASGTAPVGHIRLGAVTSQWSGEWDQLIMSNSQSRDLNAVKNVTDFN